MNSAEAAEEVRRLRDAVDCATLLETAVPAWTFDKAGSTRRARKYRRGAGEIVIVSHGGKGWWEPTGDAKGDVFSLARHLNPSLNFGQVRQILRPLAGVAPRASAYTGCSRGGERPPVPLPEAWNRLPTLRPGTGAWRYLLETRAIPADILHAAAEADAVRAHPKGSAAFAHRRDGAVCHIEARGSDFRRAFRGGTKTLFRFRGPGAETLPRLAIAEAPIDALSLAAIERFRADTLYAATGGGLGPATIAAIEAHLAAMTAIEGAILAAATDANGPGDLFAARFQTLSAAAGAVFVRLRPVGQTDWNDVLRAARAEDAP